MVAGRALIENNLIYGMLTLPSNMFYTVTLPATLWFFDKAKADDRILFIDARNIFTQIDRAHREFSEEQIRNIAIISKLHKGDRAAFVRLMYDYFQQGIERLIESERHVKPVSKHLLKVLDDEPAKRAVADLLAQWQALDMLRSATQFHLNIAELPIKDDTDIDNRNALLHDLRKAFDPFFQALHNGLKQLDKIVRQHEKAKAEAAKKADKRNAVDRNTKTLKEALEQLHNEVKNAESYYRHIHWLQERFPNAVYEDVTGLCKLATPDEVKEQDYSMNPGRYVGVVIEEDGKTEEEFLADLSTMNNELVSLTNESELFNEIIQKNIRELVGDDDE